MEPIFDVIERAAIMHAAAKHGRQKAAKVLGLGTRTVHSRLKEYGVASHRRPDGARPEDLARVREFFDGPRPNWRGEFPEGQ